MEAESESYLSSLSRKECPMEPNDDADSSSVSRNEYDSNQLQNAREQRSHIAIIQMAPPAQGSSKNSNGYSHSQPSTQSHANANEESVVKAKAGSPSKRQKSGGAGTTVRGESASSGGKKKRHHCSVQGCTYNTPHTKDLARHMRKHTGEKPFNCDRCNKSFTRYDKLVMHIRIHEGHRPFSCQFCDYAATDSSSLRKHLRTHSDERPYKCHLCNYSSKDSSQLIVHLRHHTGDSPYVCVFEGCDAAFKTPSDLSRHTRLHTGEKPYKCTFCNYRAAVKSNLNVHMKRHTNPKPKKGRKGVERITESGENKGEDGCRTSGGIIVRSSIKLDPEVLPFQYACKLCEYKADTIDLFNTHMEASHADSGLGARVETTRTAKGRPPKKVKDFAEDQRRFQCSSCNAAFKCENSLRCHMRQHGTIPNKPANVDPEIYSPKIHAHRSHPLTDEDGPGYNAEANCTVPYSHDTNEVQNYTLHEMQRMPMPLAHSVITENPAVISSNNTSALGNGSQVIRNHYDATTGHVYTFTYVNGNLNQYHTNNEIREQID